MVKIPDYKQLCDMCSNKFKTIVIQAKYTTYFYITTCYFCSSDCYKIFNKSHKDFELIERKLMSYKQFQEICC
jgi:hypothetical protein